MGKRIPLLNQEINTFSSKTLNTFKKSLIKHFQIHNHMLKLQNLCLNLTIKSQLEIQESPGKAFEYLQNKFTKPPISLYV